jgi:hypothetical protein
MSVSILASWAACADSRFLLRYGPLTLWLDNRTTRAYQCVFRPIKSELTGLTVLYITTYLRLQPSGDVELNWAVRLNETLGAFPRHS